MYKILSIDGGGIRGVIPAVIMKHIEEQTGRRIADLFDLLVGTSTGGILAAGSVVPGSDGKPKYSSEELLAIYADHGEEIFERSFWDGLTSLGGIIEETYSHKPLERLLAQYMGETTLAEAIKPVVITTYDIEDRKPYFCKTPKAKENEDRNHYLRDVTRATSAAPTYFEPKELPSLATTQTRRVLIDGGVFVNNPSMVAYSEAITMGIPHNEIMVISIGTGTTNRKIPYDKAKGWGKVQWAVPAISIMMDGSADAADYHLSQLLPSKRGAEPQRYFRFDKELETALDDLDAAHPSNIDALKKEAAAILETQSSEIEAALAALI